MLTNLYTIPNSRIPVPESRIAEEFQNLDSMRVRIPNLDLKTSPKSNLDSIQRLFVVSGANMSTISGLQVESGRVFLLLGLTWIRVWGSGPNLDMVSWSLGSI